MTADRFVRSTARLKSSAWLCILLLASAPVLVAVVTVLTTDIPKYSPLMGKLAFPLSPWTTHLPVFIVLAAWLGILSWLMVIIPLKSRFVSANLPGRVALMGIPSLLALLILWIGIRVAHLQILLVVAHGPIVGVLVPAPWVFAVGWVWTCGFIAFTVPCVTKRWMKHKTSYFQEKLS